jgi:hypothetical protein
MVRSKPAWATQQDLDSEKNKGRKEEKEKKMEIIVTGLGQDFYEEQMC